MALAITTNDYFTLIGVTTDQGAFGLHGTNTFNPLTNTGSNTLSWTWPPGLLDAIALGAHVPPLSDPPNNSTYFNLMSLQRSTTTGDRASGANVAYAVSSIPTLIPAGWAQIASWTHADVDNLPNIGTVASPYVDTWNRRSPVAYRLLVNVSSQFPSHNLREIAWNTRLLIPPQIFTAQTGNAVDLSWTVPDVSWFPAP